LASNSTTFSVIVPTRDPNPTWFRQAVASIQAQNYPHWQACVCLDADVSVEIRDWLASLAAADPRFAIIPGVGGGISSALNLAAAQATGDFLAFLDHDDLLEPTALAHFASTLAAHPAEIAYSDEDYIDPDGQPLRPNFKPGYSPELLHRCMYMGHLLAVSRSAFQSAGGFRSECDGAQDFDLVLRLVAGGAQAVHVPRVLYHWREHPSSTASGPAAKPAAHEAGRRVLSELIARQSPPASVIDGHRANAYRITRTLPPGTRASIIIPSRNPKLLQACLSSIRAHPSALPFELLVVNHRHDRVERRMASVIQSHGAISLPFDGDFNFSVLCNLAASRANGSVLVFLNDDVSLMQPDWLSSLVSTLHGDRVAIAGAQLLYPSGAIQHAGIALGLVDGAGHPGRHLFDSPNWPWINFTRDVSAVSGACLTIHRHIFEELGGFHTDFPLNYNDVDLCLRAREAGYRVVLDASVRLIHMEASTRTAGTRSSERLAFFRRWGRLVDSGDPFFSPNLSCESEGLTLRY
jgi:GT2 family glycosyltransferase